MSRNTRIKDSGKIGVRVYFDPKKGHNVSEFLDKSAHDRFIDRMRHAFDQADRRVVQGG